MISKKLLFIVNIDWFFVSHRLPIALAAIQQGYEVHLATAVTDRRAELEQHGIQVHPIELSRSSTSLLGNWRTFQQLWQVIRKVRPEVVHTVTIKPVLFGGLAARLQRVPLVVSSVSGMGYVYVTTGWQAKIRRSFTAMLYRLALGSRRQRVIFQNNADKLEVASLSGLKSKQCYLLSGSGVNLQQYPHNECLPEKPVILFAARLLHDKGLYEFIAAAEQLKPHFPDAEFVIVGDRDAANRSSITEQALTEIKENSAVEYQGFKADIATLLSKSTVVVLPSYREGLPKVLCEAAACGRAVITTDVPGCRDAIEANKTGLLVPAKDSRALAKAIESLLRDPKRCEAFGEAGRKLAEVRFDIEQIVQAHMRLYQEALP